MTAPAYTHTSTAVLKDGHTMFPQDTAKDLRQLQSDRDSLELDLGITRLAKRQLNDRLVSCEAALRESWDCSNKVPYKMKVNVVTSCISLCATAFLFGLLLGCLCL